MRVFVYEHFSAIGNSPAGLRNEGLAMRNALMADLDALPGVESTTLDEANLQRRDSRACFERFAARCRQADATCVIAPETGDLLATYTRLAREHCPWVINATLEVIDWAGNKHATAARLERLGVAHPAAVSVPGDGMPVMLKPIDGAGGVGVRCLRDNPTGPVPATAKGPVGTSVEARVERFCPGLAASVAAICGEETPLLLPPTRQHFTRPGSFEFSHAELLTSIELKERAWRLVAPILPAVHGSKGWIGIDIVLGFAEDGSQDVVIEVNPRLTSSYLALRAWRQDNLAARMVVG